MSTWCKSLSEYLLSYSSLFQNKGMLDLSAAFGPPLSSSYSDHLFSPYQNLSFSLVHLLSPSPETIMIPNWRTWLQYLYSVYPTFPFSSSNVAHLYLLKCLHYDRPMEPVPTFHSDFPWITTSSGNLLSCIVIRRISVDTKEAREGRLEEACRTSYVGFDRQTAASIQNQWL